MTRFETCLALALLWSIHSGGVPNPYLALGGYLIGLGYGVASIYHAWKERR